MSDDIIKEQEQMMTEFRNRFPNAITIEDTMRQMILMSDEIERLRKLTSELAQLMMPFAMLMTSEEQEKVMKVVRGEQ